MQPGLMRQGTGILPIASPGFPGSTAILRQPSWPGSATARGPAAHGEASEGALIAPASALCFGVAVTLACRRQRRRLRALSQKVSGIALRAGGPQAGAGVTVVTSTRCFGGSLQRLEHTSAVLGGCTMLFTVFVPGGLFQGKQLPVVYWLSGLTCSDENFTQKGAAAFEAAAELGLILVIPDTSPRGEGVPDEEPKCYDFGVGAGFYLNATTEKYRVHYNMLDYVTKELPALVAGNFSILAGKSSIMGHSMGGHGALTIALKNPGMYSSVSAFAPISNPTQVPWGKKAFQLYLGPDESAWKQYDSVELIRSYQGPPLRLLVDQGTADQFLEEQLLPGALQKACEEKGMALTLRMQEGYDHSAFFIQSFIADHLRFHSSQLTGLLSWCPESLPAPSVYSAATEQSLAATAGPQEIECLAAVAFAPKQPLQLVKARC
ncbi:unnamed protein product [Polarella glacialis]|uniref:S-formylglutathione hydrolase n=1 Tax=Polarella glacialis TaxID=89957 RepID=A0A813E840_POLGL|nr:unnamed protein product [Polarella glacialis]